MFLLCIPSRFLLQLPPQLPVLLHFSVIDVLQNINHSLDEYLEDLELSQETRDHIVAAATASSNHNSSLNFAKAALVLQNSSQIYSRKVDFLHSYAYKVQDDLNSYAAANGSSNSSTNNKKNGKRSSATTTTIDAEIEEFLNYDPYEDFLPLNDVVPTDTTESRRNINLHHHRNHSEVVASAAAAFPGGTPTHLDDSRTSLTPSSSTTRLSLLEAATTMTTSVRRGGSLLLGGSSTVQWLDQTTRLGGGANTNTTTNAAAQRALLGTLGHNNKTGASLLRLSSGACDIGEDGVLRIPGGGGSGSQSQQQDNDQQHGGFGGHHDDNDGSFRGVGAFNDDGIIDNDDNDEGGGYAMADDDDADDPMLGVLADVVVDDDAVAEQAAAQRKRVTFVESAVVSSSSKESAGQFAVKAKPRGVMDPWALLDRDTLDDAKKPRPLRIGKTIVLPPGLDRPPSECVTGARTHRVAARNRDQLRLLRRRQQLLRARSSNNNGYYSSLLLPAETSSTALLLLLQNKEAALGGCGKRALEQRTADAAAVVVVAPLSFTGLAFGNEFAYIAKATAKRKADERRELLRQQLATSEHAAAPDAQNNGALIGEDNNIGGSSGNSGGGFDFGGDYDEDDNNDYGGGGGDALGGDEDDGGCAMMNSNTGIASVDDIYRKRDIFAGKFVCFLALSALLFSCCRSSAHLAEPFALSFTDNNDNSHAATPTFEELCRAHIQAFARGAEKYASETKLSVRVGQWQKKLMPLLEEEEQRQAFDMHAYGNTVIQIMEKQIIVRRHSLRQGGTPEDAPAMKDSTCSKIVEFRDVTRDCPPFEVCRMFLAALSLNNSGNIEFITTESSTSSLDSLKAELLCSDIERPMETYLAPSVVEEAF